MDAIRLENVCKNYGETRALKSIHLAVKEKTIHGFLGPNGAGKSTTMSIIAGLLKRTSGEVYLFDQKLEERTSKEDCRIGILPEFPPLYTNMIVRDYLLFVGRIHSLTKNESQSRFDELIERLKLQKVATRLIGNLSKGYRQRVGIAAAMIFNPKVLILDEPMIGLDPQSIIEIRELIKSLKEEHTVLLSSHQLHDVSKLCDDITIISNGETILSGSYGELTKEKSLEDVFQETILNHEGDISQ